METEGVEADLALQRASQTALIDVQKSAEWRLAVNTYFWTDMAKLDVFQEDPQLLDPLLTQLLPPIVSRYLDLIQDTTFSQQGSSASRYAAALGHILLSFCKVRGRKVVARFLSNEPRYLHSLFTAHRCLELAGEAQSSQQLEVTTAIDWKQHYIVLLWLSHLVLTPFDLATFSTSLAHEVVLGSLKLPAGTPQMAVEAIKAALNAMGSAMNRQVVAAELLFRLVLRPDMLKLGLLDVLIAWSINTLEAHTGSETVHKPIGLLLFLNGIVASGSLQSISDQIQVIYDSITHIFDGEDERWAALRSSATAKRLSVKIQRNVVVQLLQGVDSSDVRASSIARDMIDNCGVLGDAIDYFLRALSDRDTQVRMAASKALALVALKLDKDMADEVVSAVIGALNEDVLEMPNGRSLEAVNPLQWHGLTLTLSHMLFRRTPSTADLGQILTALYVALNFEQKSSSGGSIGGNVRDAANYGLWSLARRYTTKELLSAQSAEQSSATAVIQEAAINLICAACLDPVGNVRRGSSAALQELIGRHPDTIANGIALVQTVDYLAVGLRSRALTEVSAAAAELDSSYRDRLVQGLCGWRGLMMPDQASRSSAAEALGVILGRLDPSIVQTQISRLSLRREDHKMLEPELLEGRWLAVAEIVREYTKSTCQAPGTTSPSTLDSLGTLPMWCWLKEEVNAAGDTWSTRGRRAAFGANGILALVNAISLATSTRVQRFRLTRVDIDQKSLELDEDARGIILQSLALVDESSPSLQNAFLEFATSVCSANREHLATELLLAQTRNASISKQPGILRAMGRLWTELDSHVESSRILKAQIVKVLVRLASAPLPIEARAIALRSLGTIAKSPAGLTDEPELATLVDECTLAALDDYTINERGDVGSILRSQALLSTFQSPPLHRPFVPATGDDAKVPDTQTQCYLSAIRLSLEKLDRVRLDAVQALLAQDPDSLPWQPYTQPDAGGTNLATVSTYEHFFAAARFLVTPAQASMPENLRASLIAAILAGFASSAGAGTATVLPVARAALTDALALLPSSAPRDRRTSSLSEISTALTAHLKTETADRTLIPALELTAYLLDAQALQRAGPPSNPRALLSRVQHAHYRSAALPKILAAVSAYRGLAGLAGVRRAVLGKLVGMLGHPFAAVRVAVAEALWVLVREDGLVKCDWRAGGEACKGVIGLMKARVEAGGNDDI